MTKRKTETVEQLFRRRFREEIDEDVHWDFFRDGVLSRCESPIEERLAAALYFMSCDWHMPFPFNGEFEWKEAEPLEDRWVIVPQLVVGSYRLDFGVIMASPVPAQKTVRCAVECDGHDFHEKTKEQARRDKSRDRFLATQGWPVLRFTGSEIHADAVECVRQIEQFLNEQIQRGIEEDGRRG